MSSNWDWVVCVMFFSGVLIGMLIGVHVMARGVKEISSRQAKPPLDVRRIRAAVATHGHRSLTSDEVAFLLDEAEAGRGG